jgi:hypothetical protein
MANIKDLIKSIEAADSSFDEKLAAINQMEETLVSMRAQEEQAVQENVDLIVEAIKVMERKVENQLEIAKSIVPEKGDKGDKGERGLDGKNGVDGKDGRDGINGRDGQDGQDGVSVTDAKIDFDGSLVITLSTGQEINVGEVVAPELQEKIKLVTSGGAGTVLPSQTGNANKYLKTDGAGLSWAAGDGTGTVTSVGGTGTVSGISLSGTVTTSGNLTLGGTLDLSSPPAIGGTAPAAGTFTTLIGGGGSANYEQITGGSAGNAVQFQSLGSDANVSLAIQPKGTGAVDLAAGSKGVNISNGGTVTAITRTAAGSAYTSKPTIAISAPTTAGGVQAVATVDSMFTDVATVAGGGTGYTVGDTLTIVGGTPLTTAATYTVATVSSGVITAVTVANGNSYTTIPTNPVSVTGGTGSGATLNLTYGVRPVFTITNAGSGYVEQPTVTFSGGGGSGAAAYATVGTTPVITSLANNIRFANAGGLAFQLGSAGTATVNYLSAQGSVSGGSVLLGAAGSDGNIPVRVSSLGTSAVSLFTNNSGQEALRATHTASAVNYVQITGATTASKVVAISAQGSDTDVTLSLSPKGAGTIRFGTYTAGVLTPTGYITITDSGGTSRRLLVG